MTGSSRVERSETVALEWLIKAVEYGDTDAQSTLGEWYKKGRGGLTIDYKRSFELLHVAAEKADPEANHNIARNYKNGWGCEQSCAKAIFHYKRAVELGTRAGSATQLANVRAEVARDLPFFGKRVVLFGLSSNEAMNGARGLAVDYSFRRMPQFVARDPSTGHPMEGRYVVRLDDEEEGTQFKVKPRNLRLEAA